MPIKHKKSHPKEENIWLTRIHAPGWVVLILAITFVLRIPSFFEPYYYGDEMIYLNLGEAIRRGMVLYRDIHDNKPPLLYLLAGVAGNVFWFRAILAGWMMVTTILFWRLAEALFPKDHWIVKAATVVFAVLTTIPLLEGQIANAELFMLGPTIAGFLILVTQKLSPRNIFAAGLLFSISTLFKVPAAFDLLAIVFLWFATTKLRRTEITNFIKQSSILAAGFLLPIGATVLWYWLHGALSQYLVAAFLQNVGYLSAFRPEDVVEPFLVRNAPLLLRGGILATGLVILFIFQKKLTANFLFITSWLLFALFAVTLSERPYPHYLVQLVPAVSLLLGVLVAKQSKLQSLSVIPLFLVLLTVLKFQFWYYPTFSYYNRFVSFATGQTTKNEYFSEFDQNVPRNYKIAEFIITSSKRDDPIFVWGDSPAIYALTNRLPPIKYVANYHITDFSNQDEVIEALSINKPRFIVVLPGSPPFPYLSSFLQSGYLLINEVNGAQIWKSINPNLIN